MKTKTLTKLEDVVLPTKKIEADSTTQDAQFFLQTAKESSPTKSTYKDLTPLVIPHSSFSINSDINDDSTDLTELPMRKPLSRPYPPTPTTTPEEFGARSIR